MVLWGLWRVFRRIGFGKGSFLMRGGIEEEFVLVRSLLEPDQSLESRNAKLL
jgi:hypothetical protein